MFLSLFNLTQHPFMENPPIDWILTDPRFEQALARLKFFQDQGSIALIIGQTGIGKSSLLRRFVHNLPQNRYHPIYVHLTPINANAFLRLIVTKLGEAPKMGKDRLCAKARESSSGVTLRFGTLCKLASGENFQRSDQRINSQA